MGELGRPVPNGLRAHLGGARGKQCSRRPEDDTSSEHVPATPSQCSAADRMGKAKPPQCPVSRVVSNGGVPVEGYGLRVGAD